MKTLLASKLPLLYQIIRYGVVGVLNNLFGYLIYLLVTWLWLDPKFAISLLYPIGAATAYFGHSKYSFAGHPRNIHTVLRYLLAHLVGYGVNFLMLLVLVDRFGFPHQAIQGAAIFLVAGVLFVMFRYFVFPAQPAGSAHENHGADLRLRSRLLPMLAALAASAIVVLIVCLLSPPKWDTNDDVGMSMIAHGFGIAVTTSPNILFSNVVWGYLVRLLPTLGGVIGYSIATLGVLVVSGAVVLYALRRSGAGYLACLATLVLLWVRPVLFPQFTINAGLLAVAAICCYCLCRRQYSSAAVVAGSLLAFLSFIVRGPEFFLVFIAALPLLPWRVLFERNPTRVAISILALAIAVSAAVDYRAYQRPEWQAFNDLNPARAAFTDYGAGPLLQRHPDILKRHRYSNNDIDLISNWFFVDAQIANPAGLQSMLAELGPLPAQANARSNAWLGVKALWSPRLVIPMTAALLLALLFPHWRIVCTWGLCVAAVFVLGLMGRPGVLHVYIPLASLLLVAPLLYRQVAGWRARLSAALLLVAALANTVGVLTESRKFRAVAEQASRDLATLPDEPLVIWGGAFPYEVVYPVLGASAEAMSYRHYGLGTSTLAPFTFAGAEQNAGRGLLHRLATEDGVLIMAQPQNLRMLAVYCREHLHGELKELSRKQYGTTPAYGTIEVSRQRCEAMLGQRTIAPPRIPDFKPRDQSAPGTN